VQTFAIPRRALLSLTHGSVCNGEGFLGPDLPELELGLDPGWGERTFRASNLAGPEESKTKLTNRAHARLMLDEYRRNGAQTEVDPSSTLWHGGFPSTSDRH